MAYAYNAVGYIALGAAVQEADLSETYERQERIGYRSELILGEAEVDEHMKGLFPDWRAQGVTMCLHEHQGGFAFNMASVRGLHGKCREVGVSVLSGSRSRGSRRLRRLDRGGRDVGGADRGRRAGRHRSGAVGEEVLGDAGNAGDDRRADAVRRGRPGPPDVDVLEPPGGRGRDGPDALRDRGRRPAAGHPSRHRRAPRRRRRQGALRGALGDLLQAGPPFGTGRRLAARRRGRRRARSVPADDGHRPGLPRRLLRRAVARDGPLRGLPGAVQAGALWRSRGVHRGQLPGLRLLPSEPVRDPRLEPRLQDDRRRPGGRERAARRPLAAALPVPLRALRDRRPAPGRSSPYPWS